MFDLAAGPVQQAGSRILVTGPSCAGKTTIARANPGARCINLDRFASVGATPLDSADHEVTIYEGMPSGGEAEVMRFLAAMDAIIVVDAPLPVRLTRAIRRDGWREIGRFLRNEIGWRGFCVPLLADARFAAKRVAGR